MMRNFLEPLIKFLQGKNISMIGAGTFFLIALLWVIFGFMRLVFILLMTVAGYTMGAVFFRDSESLRKWLNRILPPGPFR